MAGPDLSVVTSVIDFDTVVLGVMAWAAAYLVVLIAWRGAQMVLNAVRGGEYESNDGVVYSGRELDRIWREEFTEEDRRAWHFESKQDFLDTFTRVR